MEVSRTTLEQVYQDIVNSLGYRTTVGPVDKSKVSRRYEGVKTTLPSARLARAAWRVAALLSPLTPPPPPPTYKKVAPKTANKEGASDARFCLVNQPGVVRQADGTYRDDVARYDQDGLHLGGRSDACTQVVHDGLVGAKSMDGRAPCELPTVGDPEKNTGSWTV